MRTGKIVAIGASIALLYVGLSQAPETNPVLPCDVIPTGPDCGPPNILIIITDDQRDGTVKDMPETFRLFAEEGVTFSHAFATTPICCPSRASIMTGRYAHNHGVEVFTPYVLDQRTTLQRYLKDEGYGTAFYGKYLNAWSIQDDPPHFDDWAMFPQSTGDTYVGGRWNVNGTVKSVHEYSTHFIADRALDFFEASETDDQKPWLMFVSTPAAHLPYVAEETYEDAPVSSWDGNPAVFDDISDKPAYVAGLAQDKCNLACGVAARKGQVRTLLSVDVLVKTIFDTLEENNEANNTLAFFVSDNGLMWGEYGLDGKRLPYGPSIKIPMYMRWPAQLDPDTDKRLSATIDIAPTVLEAVKTEASSPPQDGVSLLDPNWKRTKMLLESWGGIGIPDWFSIRTQDSQYIEYYTREGSPLERELYDLGRDPWQLNNLLKSMTAQQRRNATHRLHKKLSRLRTCYGSSCIRQQSPRHAGP